MVASPMCVPPPAALRPHPAARSAAPESATGQRMWPVAADRALWFLRLDDVRPEVAGEPRIDTDVANTGIAWWHAGAGRFSAARARGATDRPQRRRRRARPA